MKKQYKTVFMPLEDLIPYPDNAKIHDQEQVALLAGRITKEGFNQPIVVDKDNVIVKGHGRRLASIKLKLKEVPVVVLDDLSPNEIKAARLADNKIAEKADYELDKIRLELADIVEEIDLDSIGFDIPSLNELGLDEFTGDSKKGDDSDDEKYTKKIQAPIYEIKGEKPSFKDMYDVTKMKKLKEKIDATDMSEDEHDFLHYAAQRHNVFSYDKIAEYYAHASKEVQGLMEDSALVIIDFDKAIENGFVSLSNEIAEVYSNDED